MLLKFSSINKIRLDLFLQKELPLKLNKDNISNSKIRRLIISGSVFVDNVQIRRPAFELRKNSFISVNYDEDKFFYEKTAEDIKYNVIQEDVLYEDEYFIVINKPAFFPTEETIVGKEKRDNLHDAVVRWLWQKEPNLRNPPYVGIIHRLDKETSGAILFTKQRCVNNYFSQLFKEHKIQKTYNAISAVNKSIKFKENFIVENFLNRISPKSKACKWGSVLQKDGGLLSKTEFTVLKIINNFDKKYLFIKALPFTGRTHQIRVHLSQNNMPILGDTLYNGVDFKRIMLHSKSLEFVHPITNESLCIKAPLPKEFEKILHLNKEL